MATTQYRPGDIVPASGIYLVLHDQHHRPHEVTYVKGEVFPPCNHCGYHPRFSLERAAHHVHNHDQFR